MSNQKLATALFDGFSARDLSAWYASLADDFVASYPSARMGLNREQARAYNEPFLTAFSDLHVTYQDSATNGDVTMTKWTGTGTHDGPLALSPTQVAPPTGKKGNVSGVVIVQTKNGKIMREETYWNLLELLTQLGLMPGA